MTDQTVEYVIRVRIVEPPDRLDIPEENRIGDVMFDWIGEIENVAEEYEIASREPMTDPERPTRVRCAAQTLDPTKHYATSTRCTLTTPGRETLTLCSAACALSWLCHEVPADAQKQRQNRAAPAPGEPESEEAA